MKCSENGCEKEGKERRDTSILDPCSIVGSGSRRGNYLLSSNTRLCRPSERYVPVPSEHRGPFVVERGLPPFFSFFFFLFCARIDKLSSKRSHERRRHGLSKVYTYFLFSLAIVDRKCLPIRVFDDTFLVPMYPST